MARPSDSARAEKTPGLIGPLALSRSTDGQNVPVRDDTDCPKCRYITTLRFLLKPSGYPAKTPTMRRTAGLKIQSPSYQKPQMKD